MSVPVLFYGIDDISSALAVSMLSSDPDVSPACEVRKAVPALLSGTGDSVPALFAKILSDKESCDLFVNGPLSSAASLILLYPELKNRIRQIIFAGGCFRGGNASVCAEKNVLADPEAADVILRSGIPVVIAPLECGDQVYLAKSETDVLSDACGDNDALSRLIRESAGIPFRSLAAAGYLLDESLYETRALYVAAELSGEYCRGSLIPDWRNQYGKPCNVKALMHVDRKAVIELLLETLPNGRKEAAL